MIYKNINIFEINTRVLLRRLNLPDILHVPDEYWQNLKEIGMTHIWLMGVWKTSTSSIKKYCFSQGLISEYKNTLDDWSEKDVIGSPYAIEDYKVHPWIAKSNSSLRELKVKLNKIGLGLILDFIPNHFNSESKLLKSHPDVFLKGSTDHFNKDSKTFFSVPQMDNAFNAHGKDPYFDAWTDTAQLNYFSEQTHNFMIKKMLKIADLCDGVRCDMAMLVLNEVFNNTWGGSTKQYNIADDVDEFWKTAISSVKKKYPDMIFIAEAYWNLEWQLQQLGFDFTYDKRLYDRIVTGEVQHIQEHLKADSSYQEKSLRFIENHDEKRALTVLGKEQSKAAAVIISSVPGAKLFHDGQFEGRKIKLPVQLGREPLEEFDEELKEFYENLLKQIGDELSEELEWIQLFPGEAWSGNGSFRRILCWWLSGKTKKFLVCVNYSNEKSQCRVKLPEKYKTDEVLFSDLLNNENYMRLSKELNVAGLYVELEPWKYHLFEIT